MKFTLSLSSLKKKFSESVFRIELGRLKFKQMIIKQQIFLITKLFSPNIFHTFLTMHGNGIERGENNGVWKITAHNHGCHASLIIYG